VKALPRIALLVWLIAAAALPCAADQVLLNAIFDDKTIDAPIGRGGPEVGEPAWIDANLDATVRSTPFDTPCLELRGGDQDNSYFAGFELLGGDVTVGMVVIIMDVWFDRIDPAWEFGLRVMSSDSMQTFLYIEFRSSGRVYVFDPNGGPGEVAEYPVRRSYPVLVAFDQTARTYSIWLDGVQVVADESHGVADGGIGLITPKCLMYNSPEARFWIDQIRVLDWLPPVPVEATSWGKVRALYHP